MKQLMNIIMIYLCNFKNIISLLVKHTPWLCVNRRGGELDRTIAVGESYCRDSGERQYRLFSAYRWEQMQLYVKLTQWEMEWRAIVK